MGSITIRDLARNASGVVRDVAKSGRPALVTRRGKVVVALVPVDEGALEDFILANAPSFVRSLREADRDLSEGRTTEALAFLEEIEHEGSAKSPRRTVRASAARHQETRSRRTKAGSSRARSSGRRH